MRWSGGKGEQQFREGKIADVAWTTWLGHTSGEDAEDTVRSNEEGVRSTTSSEDEYSPKDEGMAAAIVTTIINVVHFIAAMFKMRVQFASVLP